MEQIFISKDGKRVSHRRTCQKCGKVVFCTLARDITSNGASQIYWLCHEHQGAINIPRINISHEKVLSLKIEIDKIPIVKNNSTLFSCAICGKLGAANHHYAPRYLFGDDCENWTQVYLCEYHHKLWHDRVTPEMCKHGK